ncbi:MAG: alpha/beta fold hydrolase [Anaerolineae bacterium]|nr:alpha/beta hydrolase [Chloroflexota bacterium]
MRPLRLLLRYLWNALLAGVLFALLLLILLGGFGAVMLPMWETAALQDNTQDGNWAWAGEQPVYYRTWGSAGNPTVVLVHGDLIEGSTIWEANAPALASEGLYVVAIDLPGYGHSYRLTEPTATFRAHTGVLAQVLNQLGLDQATLVGHGSGAGVVMQLAHEQPQFVNGMVLISPAIETPSGPLWRLIMRQPTIGRALAWMLQTGGPAWRSQRLSMVVDRNRFPDGYLESALESAHVMGSAESMRLVAISVPDDNLPEAIPELRQHALILCGAEDQACDEAEALAERFADGRSRIVQSAGYLLQVDQPALVNSEILTLLGRRR